MSPGQTQSAIMVFGKLSTQGDFVRSHLHNPQGVAFEAWLAGALEQSRGQVPNSPARFLLSIGEPQRRVVGVWIRSRDQVGREFPLAALQIVAPDVAAAPWSLLPAFYDPFLTDLEALLTAQRDGAAKALITALEGLEAPHESLIPAALYEGQSALMDERLVDFLERNLGQSELAARLAYALSTTLGARAQGGAPLTLDVPFVNEIDLFAWLEIVRACAVASPQLVWSEESARALLTLGPPALSTLAFLLDPAHPSQRRWPLFTDNLAALNTAALTLGAEVQRWLAQDLSVLRSIERIAQRGLS